MSTPTADDRARAREIAGPCAHFKPLTSPDCISWDRRDDRSCDPCLLTRRITLALAAERERVLAACAAEIDGPCGTDTLHHGLTCAPIVPHGKVYHESRCRRRDADAIRALGAPPQPARKEAPHA